MGGKKKKSKMIATLPWRPPTSMTISTSIRISLPISLTPLPLKTKSNVDMSSLYDCHTFKVAVQYCVLRPQEKTNT